MRSQGTILDRYKIPAESMKLIFSENWHQKNTKEELGHAGEAGDADEEGI